MLSDSPLELNTQSGLGVASGGVPSQNVRDKLKKAFKLSDSETKHFVDMQWPFFSKLGSKSRQLKPPPAIQRIVNVDVVQQVKQPDMTLTPAGQVSHDVPSVDRLETHDARSADRLTTHDTPCADRLSTKEPQEGEEQASVDNELTVTAANIVPKVEPLSDDKKNEEEEEDQDVVFCGYMVPGTYAGKRSADLQAVTIANIKEKINEDYYKYATDNLSKWKK